MDDLSSLLGHNFAEYLFGLGYKESQDSSESFLTLDYSPDLTKLYQATKKVRDDQVAVCLVPEHDRVLNFAGQRFLRDGNVIFMKGPFTSRVIEDVLAEADGVFAEHAVTKAAKAAQPTQTENNIALGPGTSTLPESTASEVDTDSASPEPVQHGRTFSEQVVAAELAKAVMELHIAQEQPKAHPFASSSDNPMTLLVDDNKVNLRLLEMYCKRRGIPYSTATDGAQAVEIFARHRASTATTTLSPADTLRPFDLVLMDLQMPICDGIDATGQIRALEKEHGWLKSIVFIVTGQDSPKDRLHAQEAGSDGYLVKPVGPKVLDRSVKQWFPGAEIG